jgi:hypothetical protein
MSNEDCFAEFTLGLPKARPGAPMTEAAFYRYGCIAQNERSQPGQNRQLPPLVDPLLIRCRSKRENAPDYHRAMVAIG